MENAFYFVLNEKEETFKNAIKREIDMELDILEYSKQNITFRLKGEGHTFCNLLRKELWNDDSVNVAGYKIEHTLESTPVFIVRTENKDIKKVLLDSCSRLQKLAKEARTKLAKIAKQK